MDSPLFFDDATVQSLEKRQPKTGFSPCAVAVAEGLAK